VGAAGDTVTPIGNPLTVTATPPVNPFTVANNVTGDPPPPIVTGKLVGVTAKLKSAGGGGAAATVSATATVCVSVPELPVNVSVALPAATVGATASVIVCGSPALTLIVEELAVTPAGRPETATLTTPLNPFTPVTARLTCPVLPAVTVSEAGVALNVKSAAGPLPHPATPNANPATTPNTALILSISRPPAAPVCRPKLSFDHNPLPGKVTEVATRII